MSKSRVAARAAISPIWIFVAMVAMSAVFPLIFLTATAFRTDYNRGPLSVPQQFTFDNIVTAWNNAGLGRLALNSVVVVVSSVFVVVLISTMAAFALVHMPLPARARKFGFLASLLLLALPASVLIAPIFRVVFQLGLINNYLGLILVYASLTSPFGVYMMATFFQAVPTEILQAAEVDGAGPFKRFLYVGVPLAKPAIATLTALTALGLWNDLLFSLLIIQDPAWRTITVGVSLLQPSAFVTDNPQSIVAAGLLVSIVPPIILFAVMNRSLTKGIVAGAIK